MIEKGYETKTAALDRTHQPILTSGIRKLSWAFKELGNNSDKYKCTDHTTFQWWKTKLV